MVSGRASIVSQGSVPKRLRQKSPATVCRGRHLRLQPTDGALFLEAIGNFWQNQLSGWMTSLDSTAGGRSNFLTTQWGLVAAASAEGATEARAALEELYRLYSYPVYAFIRRRGYGRQDAQDFTQDFFVHLLEKGTLGRADPRRGRFRNFLLGALEHFLAHAAERAGAGKRGGGCQWVFLDADTAEDRYQLAAPEGLTAEKLFDARWAAALVEATFARLRGELEAEGKGHLFESLQGFLLGRGRGFVPASR